jgi:hypothetical protein
MIKYEFPCYPGDEVWFIENYQGKPLYLGKDKVQMVGFTTRSVQIKLRGHQNFNKTYTWNKNVFATYEDASATMTKLKLASFKESLANSDIGVTIHDEKKNNT